MEVGDYAKSRRLHPMTLIQRLIASIPGFILLLLPFLSSPGQDAWFSLMSAIVYGLLAIPIIVLRYLRFRYRITSNEIVIQSGVVTRRNRSIPIERIHNIEIEQGLLPRLFKTAKIKIETAGSSTTEGIIELVSISEAHDIRQIVRAFQQVHLPSSPPEITDTRDQILSEHPETELDLSRADEKNNEIYAISLYEVLLSGAYRFSLLYIVVFFSGLQYFDVGPEEIVDWFERGPLRSVADFAVTAPGLTILLTVTLAAMLSWISGILVNLNKYYNFRLRIDNGKLLKKQGLLTFSEATIPVKKVQAVIMRSNPVMRFFGWWQLQVQTLGLHEQQRGYEVIAPFARIHQVKQIMPYVYARELPETYRSVSRLHIRRTFVRYSLLIIASSLTAWYFWEYALWGFILLPFAFFLAVLEYRNHGYVVQGNTLFVRRGVFRHYVWIIPIEKCQAFELRASVFQRRLDLVSFYVDTAGAGAFAYPEIIDVNTAEASEKVDELYAFFSARSGKQQTEKSDATFPASHVTSINPDKERWEPFSDRQDLEDRSPSSR